MNPIAKSWKTTTLGVLALVTLLAGAATAVLDNDPATTIDFGQLVPALLAAVAAIFSKDANVTGGTPPAV